MEKEGWKVLGIILIVILVLENLTLLVLYQQVVEEEENTNICYYDICGTYPDAFYSEGICYCYDYDNLGQSYVAKSEYMG